MLSVLCSSHKRLHCQQCHKQCHKQCTFDFQDLFCYSEVELKRAKLSAVNFVAFFEARFAGNSVGHKFINFDWFDV